MEIKYKNWRTRIEKSVMINNLADLGWLIDKLQYKKCNFFR